MNSKDWVAPAHVRTSSTSSDMRSPLQPNHPPLPSPMTFERNSLPYPPSSLTQSPTQPPHLVDGSGYFSRVESGRLPGMMALSQPPTPRPGLHESPQPMARDASGMYAMSAPTFQGAPYDTQPMVRKRTRSDVLFPGDMGPVFSPTKSAGNLFAADQTPLSAHIEARMDRGFFLADNDWTCYRRNYFQVSSAFTIPEIDQYERFPQCQVSVDGKLHPVHKFYIGISSRVSNSEKKIELVQHTPKRDKGPQYTPRDKETTPGGNLRMTTIGTSQAIATFERIQFKTATANNGKRRAAQQYYICIVDLFAGIDGDQRIKVASCQSAPLVVRGRSPGHYLDHQSQYSGSPTTSETPTPYSASHPHMMSSSGADYNTSYPYPSPVPNGYQNYPQQSPTYNMLPHMSHTHSASNGAAPVPHASYQQQQNHVPYLVSNVSDPSSSESSSPDIYNSEYMATAAAAAGGMLASGKLPNTISHPNIPMHGMENGWHAHRQHQPPSQQHPARYRPNRRSSNDPASAMYDQHYPGYAPSNHTQSDGAPLPPASASYANRSFEASASQH